ncbi:MAG: hypothetical protein U0835_17775 [Isosphaeraceae bacterium]
MEGIRDPALIDQVLAADREVWTRHPDMRLDQLLFNAVRASDPDSDLFSVEDTVLVSKLATVANRLRLPHAIARDAVDPALPPRFWYDDGVPGGAGPPSLVTRRLQQGELTVRVPCSYPSGEGRS